VSTPSGTDRQGSQPGWSVALLDGDDAALFPKLTEQQLGLLRPLGNVREVDANEVLFAEGDAGYDPMVVLRGRVAVVTGGADARELVSQQAGDLMVELNVFTGEPVGATGVVMEAGSVLVVPSEFASAAAIRLPSPIRKTSCSATLPAVRHCRRLVACGR
jgi:hypothetical protein